MKVQAFGIACLLGGVIAAPVPEETQNMDMQMMPQGMEHMMTPEKMAQMMPQGMGHMMMPHMRNNMARPMDDDGNKNEPESMMTFEEMVNEVQAQVQVIRTFSHPSYFQIQANPFLQRTSCSRPRTPTP
jgi:hypothetical protein